MNMKEKKLYNKPKLTVDELSAALYQANLELEKKNLELIALQKSQIEMFANISHDLRAPITAIRSAIEYATSLEHEKAEDLSMVFHMLTTRIVSLESLINDLFLMTRLDQSLVSFKYENVDIGALLEEYYFMCESDPKFNKRKLELFVPEEFPYLVHADTDKLIRVLDNLVTNAYKYSNDFDRIQIGACIKDKQVVVWVEDSGIGIEESLLEKIFERTFTVSKARTPESATGAGLGLAITKLIVERHNGQIWCESKEGIGSKFLFTLPIVE